MNNFDDKLAKMRDADIELMPKDHKMIYKDGFNTLSPLLKLAVEALEKADTKQKDGFHLTYGQILELNRDTLATIEKALTKEGGE